MSLFSPSFSLPLIRRPCRALFGWAKGASLDIVLVEREKKTREWILFSWSMFARRRKAGGGRRRGENKRGQEVSDSWAGLG